MAFKVVITVLKVEKSESNSQHIDNTENFRLVVITVLKVEKSESNSQQLLRCKRVWSVVITVLKVEKSESNSQLGWASTASFLSCNHCFKSRKI